MRAFFMLIWSFLVIAQPTDMEMNIIPSKLFFSQKDLRTVINKKYVSNDV